MKRPLLIVMIGMILGELAYYYGGAWTFCLAGLILAGLLFLWKNKRYINISFVPDLEKSVFLIGGISFVLGQVLLAHASLTSPVERELYGTKILKSLNQVKKERRNLYQSDQLMVGRIRPKGPEYPACEELSGQVSGQVEQVKVGENSITVILKRGTFIKGDQSHTRLKGKCILYGIKFPVLPGDRIQVKGKLQPLEEPANPGQFPAKIYRLSQGIRTQFMVSSGKVLTRPSFSPKRIAYQIQKAVGAGYMRGMSAKEYPLLKAMVLGDKSELSYEERTLYEENGAAHLLSISGLHVSIAAGRVFRFLRKRKIPYGPSCIMGSLFVLFYGMMVSGGSSLIRASLMFLTFLGAEFLGAEYDMGSSMSLAMILMLMESPWRILDGGCIISFLSIFAIGLILPLAKAAAGTGPILQSGRGLYTRERPPLPQRIKDSFYTGIILSMVTAPVIMTVYSEWSPYSLVLNLVIIPAMVPLMLSALIGGIFFGTESPIKGRMIGNLLHLAGRVITVPAVAIIKIFHLIFVKVRTIPGALLVTGHLTLANVLAIYIIEMALFYFWTRKKYWKAGMIIVLTLILATLPVKKDLSITMLDVGQGDGILIQFPNGKNMLIDSGSTSEKDLYRYTLASALKYYGHAHLDYVVITHFDDDHISGIREMLEAGYPIGVLFVPETGGADRTDPSRAKITDLAKANETRIKTIKQGDEINPGEVRIHCLHPEGEEYIFQEEAHQDEAQSSSMEFDRNSVSVVLYLTYKDFDAMFTGDIGEDQEKNIMTWLIRAKNKNPRLYPEMDNGLSFLKCAHHGSRYSSCPFFLTNMRPAIAGISAGRKNRYGHPGEQTLRRLKKCGTQKIFCTSWRAAVRLETDGKKMRCLYLR